MIEIVTVADGICAVCGSEASYGLMRDEKLVARLCGVCVYDGRGVCARKVQERARELQQQADDMGALADLVDQVPVGEWPGEEWGRN